MSLTAAEQEQARAFVARLPQIEERIGGLILGPHSGWQTTPDSPNDGVIGIVHTRVVHDGPASTLTLNGWFGRDGETGEVVGRYGMRLLGEGALVNWTSGITEPGDVRFREQFGNYASLLPNFAAANMLADLLPNAAPIPVPILPPEPTALERLERHFDMYYAALGSVIVTGERPSELHA